MRVIDPERVKFEKTLLCKLSPGDVVYMLGNHYLVTEQRENSYIMCVCLKNGRVEHFIENRECLPINMEAVIK